MRIKDLRDERGLSQRGARNVSIDNMKRIADGFGVTFHEMTEGME